MVVRVQAGHNEPCSLARRAAVSSDMGCINLVAKPRS